MADAEPRSPLKRLPSLANSSKFVTCWTSILSGSDPTIPSTPVDQDNPGASGQTSAQSDSGKGKGREVDFEDARERWYQDLFCLRVNAKALEEMIVVKNEDDLAQEGLKRNISDVFTTAVKILQAEKTDLVKTENVLETLIPLLRHLLTKRYSNYSFDVMNLLAGSLDRSDAVFGDLVSAIDTLLQDIHGQLPEQIRHRILQLTLIIAASINQGSINAYFLRRSIFSTLIKFIMSPLTGKYTYEATLLLGILANFRKYESRNPYLIRIEDLVEEGVMQRIEFTANVALIRVRNEYSSIVDDSPPTFVATLTSLVASLRLTEIFSLPFFTRLSGGSAETKPSETSPSKGAKAKGQETLIAGKEDNPFKNTPSAAAAVLLPLYDLLNSNKAFCALVLSETDDSSEPLLRNTLISLSSYVFCHAASSYRSRAYSRMCLIILTILCEEGGVRLAQEEGSLEIRLCRQRLPMLPFSNDKRRPPICAILDSVVIYLRHNLHKKLDVDTYIVAVKLVHRIMWQLKNEHARIPYDWVDIWRSLISLAAFIVSKIGDLRLIPRIDTLIETILVAINFAAIWGDHFLPSERASTELYYEILRAEQILRTLGDIGDPAELAQVPTTPKYPPTSPRSHGMGNGKSSSYGKRSGSLLECVRNINTVVDLLGGKVEEFKESSGLKNVEAEDVMRIIASTSMDEVHLFDFAALDDVRRHAEASQEAFFREFTRYVSKDALTLIPSSADA